MTTAIILAGHGSQISPQTAGLVWHHVDSLRAMGIADEVTAAFWKEMPSFHTFISTLAADDITVVPLFTAQGYFTQTVIPTEMGLTGSITHRDGRTIRYTNTLSEHPYLTAVVRQRIESALNTLACSPDDVAVAILGHSTRRSKESRKATESQAEKMRAVNIAAEVVAAYLDDTPSIPDIYEMTKAPVIIAVPFFLALGSHTTIDVPGELGLEPGETRAIINNRTVYYTDPVGTEDSLLDVILELIRDSGAPVHAPRDGSVWGSFPSVGRDALWSAVTAAGNLPFGQLMLSPYTVYPLHGDGELIPDIPSLRTRIRENPFRPLHTSTDLPAGWRVIVENADQLHAVVETIYPGVVADWALNQHGEFHANSLNTTLERQTGMFRDLLTLDDAQRADLVSTICGQCARHPTWFSGATPSGHIPCPEACNLWLTKALETKETV